MKKIVIILLLCFQYLLIYSQENSPGDIMFKCTDCGSYVWSNYNSDIIPIKLEGDTIYAYSLRGINSIDSETPHLHTYVCFNNQSRIILRDLDYYDNLKFYGSLKEYQNLYPETCTPTQKTLKIKEDAENYAISKCPYGYISFDWNTNYRILDFEARYTNLNKKSIKYLDIYWSASNSVGDPRGSGIFKCTGPIQYGYSKYWDRFNESYRLSVDVEDIHISKIHITYIDGTQITLSGDKIKYFKDFYTYKTDYISKFNN